MTPGARREAILGAARALLMRRMREAVTVADPPDAAGLSKGGSHHRSAAEEDPPAGVRARMTDQGLAVPEAARGGPDGDALAGPDAVLASSQRPTTRANCRPAPMSPRGWERRARISRPPRPRSCRCALQLPAVRSSAPAAPLSQLPKRPRAEDAAGRHGSAGRRHDRGSESRRAGAGRGVTRRRSCARDAPRGSRGSRAPCGWTSAPRARPSPGSRACPGSTSAGTRPSACRR